jgi:hypothetical protein
VIAAQFGQRPGQGADQGWAVHALDPEPGQLPARQDHPGVPAAVRAPVMSGDDQLIAPVAALRAGPRPSRRAGKCFTQQRSSRPPAPCAVSSAMFATTQKAASSACRFATGT